MMLPLSSQVNYAVEAQDEAERLEAERKAAQSDAESEAAVVDNIAESKTRSHRR